MYRTTLWIIYTHLVLILQSNNSRHWNIFGKFKMSQDVWSILHVIYRLLCASLNILLSATKYVVRTNIVCVWLLSIHGNLTVIENEKHIPSDSGRECVSIWVCVCILVFSINWDAYGDDMAEWCFPRYTVPLYQPWDVSYIQIHTRNMRAIFHL